MHIGILQETGHADDQEKAEDNQGHPDNKRRRKELRSTERTAEETAKEHQRETTRAQQHQTQRNI